MQPWQSTGKLGSACLDSQDTSSLACALAGMHGREGLSEFAALCSTNINPTVVRQMDPGDNMAGFVEECTFTEFEDAGMACAWNPAGSCLAAGGQDGQVVVWDPRSRRVGLSRQLCKPAS